MTAKKVKILKLFVYYIFRRTKTVVIVDVTDVGISVPVFPSTTYNIVVSEGVLSGSSVFQGDASDPDNDGLTYSMVQADLNTQLNPDFVISQR